MWTGRKPNMRYFYVLGCLAETWPYMPNEHKLNSKTVSYSFVGYPERSVGCKFYNPNSISFFYMGKTYCFKDVKFGGGDKDKNIIFEEIHQSLLTGIVNNDQFLISDIVRSTHLGKGNIKKFSIDE